MVGTCLKGFRDEVIAVARRRDSRVTIKQIAVDFGISEASLQNLPGKVDVEVGNRLGVTIAESAELREARKPIRLLEQQNEVLRRASANVSNWDAPVERPASWMTGVDSGIHAHGNDGRCPAPESRVLTDALH